jgi:hypothetical protein
MHPKDIQTKRILISPLNWGFGHVARVIPLIDLFLKNDNLVFFAGNRSQFQIIRQYFEAVKWIEHEGYPFDFNKGGSFRFNLLKQLPSLIGRWKKERDEVEHYCIQHSIDVIISDHRYGFRSEGIYSIFLTHQIQLPLYWYERILQKFHLRWLRRFDEVWIPDDEQLNFAGKLSLAPKSLNARYIGIQSRFHSYPRSESDRRGTVVVVSGPLAYARQYAIEQAMILTQEDITFILPEDLKNLRLDNAKVVLATDWIKCDELILSAAKIVSRSGYSTLMDLVALKVSYSITPTPGQSEQVYLYNYWLTRSKV